MTATQPKPPRVVIVGAGFGGLTLARALRNAPVEVLLIDRHNYHTFQPLLYQVATAGLEPEEIAHAVRGIFHRQHNVRFRLGEVTALDQRGRTLTLADGTQVGYDYLVLAAGATTHYFDVEGAAEHSFPLKTVDEAVNLRAHLIRQFEHADQDPACIAEGGLNFVIIGGGPTGVEMAGALVELFQHVLRKDFPHLPLHKALVYLVEATGSLLGGFHDDARRYARDALLRRGVELRLGDPVARITADAVTLRSGARIPTRTVLWAAGIRAHPLADRLGLEQTRGGRLVVQPDLSLPGDPRVFVVGDLAGSRDARGQLHPQLAPVAMQGAVHVARQIRNRIDGKPAAPFVYRDKGIMATIGRNAAVAELGFGLRSAGFPAWVMWLFLHLLMLVGFRNRLNVLVNWAWNYFTYDRSARLIMRVDSMTAPKPPNDAQRLPEAGIPLDPDRPADVTVPA